ncbi:MAG: glycosyltransferase family 4 protein [Chloroflexi bacterium]|nr:glycosyltransferase family 4 protein [Chloroflexota bacterium]
MTYHIIGDGDGRPLLENLAEQVGVRPSVHFQGFVREEELQRQYESATVFIMPSQAEVSVLCLPKPWLMGCRLSGVIGTPHLKW